MNCDNAGMRTRILVLLVGAVSLSSLGQAPQLNDPANVTVDAAANRHAIDPRIYGVAWGSAADVADLGATLNRWGGNAVSRHNWENSTTNRAKDWFFENIPDELTGPGDGSNGQSADEFIARTFAGGAQAIMTIPLMGLLPFDNQIRCGFSVAKYGPQQAVDIQYHPDCGNGRPAGGGPYDRMLYVNDPADTSAVYPASHQGDWVEHIVDTWGAANAGGVRYYSLDNEPSLWSFDHWDVHPGGSTYDEVWGKMAEYGTLIKQKDPGALITGIEEWGWSAYFMSGIDQENGDNADREAHGDEPYVEWLLQQARSHEATQGQRILDVAALHFYPQNGEFSDDTSFAMQGYRNRSTRALWDPNYVDESWIGGTGIDDGKVKLIPRLRDWVNTNYPGTIIGVTEYNWGAETHINGGTAQADILGIFGREGLDVGVRWGSPQTGSHAYNAFKMYRNYDGAGSRFGDLSISATGSDPDKVAVFAALRSSDRALTIMIVAKEQSADSTPVNVNLANFTPGGNAARWQLTSTNVIAPLPSVAPSGNALSVIVPPQSITLLVIPGTWVDAPASVTATATSTSSVSLTWPAAAGASSYQVYRSSMGGPFNFVDVAPSTNFVDGGRSADTSYLYRIRAVSGGISSGFSPADVATTVIFTDDPLMPGTVAKSVHLTQLRTAVNALRAAVGLGNAELTDNPLVPGTTAKALHYAQLRHAANQARARAGLSHRSYADTALVTGVTIKATHVTDVRNAVK